MSRCAATDREAPASPESSRDRRGGQPDLVRQGRALRVPDDRGAGGRSARAVEATCCGDGSARATGVGVLDRCVSRSASTAAQPAMPTSARGRASGARSASPTCHSCSSVRSEIRAEVVPDVEKGRRTSPASLTVGGPQQVSVGVIPIPNTQRRRSSVFRGDRPSGESVAEG